MNVASDKSFGLVGIDKTGLEEDLSWQKGESLQHFYPHYLWVIVASA